MFTTQLVLMLTLTITLTITLTRILTLTLLLTLTLTNHNPNLTNLKLLQCTSHAGQCFPFCQVVQKQKLFESTTWQNGKHEKHIFHSNWIVLHIMDFDIFGRNVTDKVGNQKTLYYGIVKRLLIAYFIRNKCVKVIASQRWDVFRHSAFSSLVST